MKKLILILCVVFSFGVIHAGDRPNVLFFLVDDWGWMDAGCQGSEFYETPRIDALAKEGVRFTQAYAAHPKCIGSRMGVMMGKYPARIGNPGRNSVMPLHEKTMAEAFRENGYATFFTGKWHLAGHENKDGPMPEDQGFDINRGGGHNGMPATYFYPYQSDHPKRKAFNVQGLEGGEEGEYLTDRLTDETIAFIRNRDKSKPFFAFVSHYAVHDPIEAKPEMIRKYEKKAKQMGIEENSFVEDGPFLFDAVQNNPGYAAMLESVDESLGRLLDLLKAEGLKKNTIVVVTSDNGGKAHDFWRKKENQPTSNLPLRAAKSLTHEGGIRIPMIVKWPGNGKSGVVSEVLTHGVDHYASLLEMVGLPLQPQQHLDSVSYVPALKGEDDAPRPALFWNFPRTAGHKKQDYINARAVRFGDYKLIEYWQNERVELFNLAEDVGEQNDLSQKMPEKTAELLARLQQWVIDTDAPTLSYGQ